MKKEMMFIVLLALLIGFASSELSCPTGQINDSYPGDCGLYTDSNQDRICDYSQETPVVAKTPDEIHDIISGQDLKLKTVGEVAEIYGICFTEYSYALSQRYGFVISPTDSFLMLHDKGVLPSTAKEIAESILGVKGAAHEEENISIAAKTTPTKEYYMWQITLVLVVLYLTSLYLVKIKKISFVKNRKIWNIVLMISFIVTAVSSIFLLIKINYGYSLFDVNWTQPHIIFGYIMLLISIFHALWHMPYWKSYFTFNK